jgi:hypothetical protein
MQSRHFGGAAVAPNALDRGFNTNRFVMGPPAGIFRSKHTGEREFVATAA